MRIMGRIKATGLRAYSLSSEPPIIREKPSWITDGELGSIDEDDDILILVEHHDPFAEITHFTVSGDLPPGLSINTYDGSIAGSATVDVSGSYTFTISMHTASEVFSRVFTLHVVSKNTEVVWKTNENLGEVDSGSGFQTLVSAVQIRK